MILNQILYSIFSAVDLCSIYLFFILTANLLDFLIHSLILIDMYFFKTELTCTLHNQHCPSYSLHPFSLTKSVMVSCRITILYKLKCKKIGKNNYICLDTIVITPSLAKLDDYPNITLPDSPNRSNRSSKEKINSLSFYLFIF